MKLMKISEEMKDLNAGFQPEVLTDEELCVVNNNINNIIKYLKNIKAKTDANIKSRNITEAGIWDIIIKTFETKRLDQKKVKKVLEDNGGLEDFQIVTKSTRMNIKINKDRALKKTLEMK